MEEPTVIEKTRVKYAGREKPKIIIYWSDKAIEVWETRSEAVESPFLKGENCYLHHVNVRVGLHQTAFKFYGSVKDYHDGKELLDHLGLLEAFTCFVEDALNAVEYGDVDEFAEEYGITRPSEAFRAWRGCLNALRKLRRLGFRGYELYDLAGALYEVAEAWAQT